MLRAHGVGWPSGATPLLADAYVEALRSTSDTAGNPWRLNGNLWGFLQHADDPGELGASLIGFGGAAVPSLTALLDDEGPVFYEGSREAMTGNRLQFLIKDYAAYYLGKIEHVEVPLGADRAARDAEIARLKQSLRSGG